MAGLQLAVAVLVVISACCIPSVILVDSMPCEGTFSPFPTFTANWLVEGSVIHFTVTGSDSNNQIWIALGFVEQTESPFMFPSDVVVASTVDMMVQDRHITAAAGRSVPIPDAESNIFNTSVTRVGSVLTMTFSRKLVTSDDTDDVSIDTPRHWIWAIGSGNFNQHNLRGNSLTPISLPTIAFCPAATTTSIIMVQPSSTLSFTFPTFDTASIVVSPTPSPTPVAAPCQDSFQAGNSFSAVWQVTNDTVSFAISARTTGWVGIGFSEDQFMPMSDIVLGGFDGPFPLITDRYALQRATPGVDMFDNLILRSALLRSDGVTVVSFMRKLNTADPNGEDIDLAGRCVNLLWAWGTTITRESGPSQHTSRGVHGIVCFPDVSQCPDSPPSSNCNDGNIRVIDETDDSGRVQICENGIYNSICSEQWTDSNAEVACRDLGLVPQVESAVGLSFDSSGYDISYNSYDCAGNEPGLHLCNVSLTQCSGGEAGVLCGGARECGDDQVLCLAENTCLPSSYLCDGHPDCSDLSDEARTTCVPLLDSQECTPDSIRLTGGDDQYSGKVETCIDGAYTTICDYTQTIEDAVVICRQLFNRVGYPVFRSGNPALRQNDTFRFKDLQCDGNENSIDECSFYIKNSESDCSLDAVFVVQCVEPQPCQDGDIRLSNARRSTVDFNSDSIGQEGIVQKCMYEMWGDICGSWSPQTAAYTCQSLGYSYEGALAIDDDISSLHIFGPTTLPVFGYANYDCEGQLQDCITKFVDSYEMAFGCGEFRSGAALMCPDRPRTECEPGNTRFILHYSLDKGLVEVCIGNTWRPLCSNGFDDYAAQVVCANMGFEREQSYYFDTTFDVPSGDPVILDLKCIGNESNILNCVNDTIPISSGGGSSGDADTCTSFAIARCPTYHLAVIPSPSLSDSSLIFDQGREATIECHSSFSTNNLAIKNATQILSLNASGTSVSYTDCEADLSLDQPHQCTGILKGSTIVNMFSINILSTSGENSNIIVRVSVVNIDVNVSSMTSNDVKYFVESLLLSQFPIELDGAQEISCDSITRRPVDYEHGLQRYECSITTYPSRPEYFFFVMQRLLIPFPEGKAHFISSQTFAFSDIGFCDFETSFTTSFDVYSWPETKIGEVAEQRCNFGVDGVFGAATRLCTGNGWDAPNLAQCVDATTISGTGCNDGELRLVNVFERNTSASGVLEVCQGGVFGTVCSDIWNITNPRIACSQLGYPFEDALVLPASTIGLSHEGSILLDGVFCEGTENSIMDCMSNPIGSHDCSHDNDVILFCEESSAICSIDEHFCASERRCIPGEYVCDGCVDCLPDFSDEQNCPDIIVPCEEGEVRLIGGPDEFTGVVTVCLSGAVTTVCTDSLDYRDATVLCRQAGFSDRAGYQVETSRFQVDLFGLPQAYGGLQCTGTEDNIAECSVCTDMPLTGAPGVYCCSGSNRVNADEYDAVAISCLVSPSCSDGDVRLVGGTNQFEGIVELCVGGRYGYPCTDISSYGIDLRRSIGITVCRDLGLDPAGAIPFIGLESFAQFGSSSSPPVGNGAYCTLSSNNFEECVLPNIATGIHQCQNDQSSYGVICRDLSSTGCVEGEVRLVTQSTENEGILQICSSGRDWVSVCADSLDNMDTRVACSQLGFPSSNAAVSGTISGYPLPNNITLALNEIFNCTGDEKTLQSCLSSQNEEPDIVDSCNLARIHCPALPVVDVIPRSQDGTYEFDILGTVNLTCITNGIYDIEVTHTDLTGTVNTVVYSYGASTADILVRSPFIGANLAFEAAGTYNCTARHVVTGSISSSVAIQVAVAGPQLSEFSRSFVRFSGQNLPRLNNYIFNGANFDQETYDSITALFVNEAIPDTLPGIQIANCSTVDPRPEDTSRLFDRMECVIKSYPPVDNNIEIAQTAFYTAVESPSIYCRNSFSYSENGFCNYEETQASFGPFAYIWQETVAGSDVTLPCAHNVLGTVRRRCSIGAKWEDPVFDRCDTLPEVIISSGDFVSVEIGRTVSLSCDVTSLSNNHTISWYKIDGNGELVPVQDLLDFTLSSGSFNQFGQLTLNPNASFGDFFVLFSTVTDQNYDRLNLTGWNLDNGGLTVTTPESIAGTYVCQGINEAGYREANVTLSVEVPSPQSSSSITYIRATVLNFDFVVPVFNRELQFSSVESFVLESIAVERESIQIIRCREINNRPDNIGTRIDCSIEEFPERQSTVLVGTEVIVFLDSLGIVLSGSSNSSETGFCDYEQTSDPIFGNYTWNETLGGQSLSQPCANGVESDAIRTCVGLDEGWNVLIDFSNCREIIPLPEEFEFYLRLSSDFDNFTSGNADNAVNTLRIAIELTVSVTAECFIVPMRSIDLFQRVECRINGTVDSNSNSAVIEAMIVSSLLQQNLMVPNSNISNIGGFCDTETVEEPQGTIITWNESFTDSLNILPCPFGPPNATATRNCTARLLWGSQNTENCATVVTEEFENLVNTLAEVNVDNVADLNANLTGLVTRSESVTDQSVQNAVVVSRVLSRTAEIFQLPTLTLPVAQAVTSGIVSIVNDVEEWPVANIEEQASIIIQAFENITVALVTQENFTNLTVVTEDVVLVVQRIDAETLSLTGRTFTANQFNGGALQVDSMNDNNQTNQDLQDNQIATLTFPSGIDFEQLLGPDVENVGIFFAIYDQDTLFPSLGEPNEVTSDPVGSAVVGFTIAGLPFGTILPQPLLIDFRVANPFTGGSENISNATCVFYNFTILDWDPSGCTTVFDPDNPSEVLCECIHLTNFACLVDISSRVGEPPPFTEEQTVALEVVSYVGVTLSLIGLVITMITLLIFKNIRKRDVTKFHLQLCVSLMCMYIVFVSGIDKTDNRGGCVTVGVLIHYFSLVSWMWMGAEALLMFQKLIIIFGQTTWKYLLLMSILCWTIPIVPVVIPVGIDPDFYITTFDDNSTRSGFCFISDVGVFFGAFLGPILLMIIFNTVVYVLVIRVLVKHNLQKKKHKIDQSLSALEVVKLLLSICGIMILFGLTWIFAIFTFVSSNRDVAFALQFIFAFFNALQGFWIFFFFVFLNAEARQAWKQLFCPCASKTEAPTTSKTDISSKNKYFTGSKGRSVSTMSTSDDGMDTIKNNMYSASPRKTSMDHVIMKNSNVIMEEEEEEEAPLPVITITDPQFVEEKPSNGLQKEETDKDYHLRDDSLNCEARVKRHLTFNEKKHEVEVVEMDFFDDDDDNNDNLIVS